MPVKTVPPHRATVGGALGDLRKRLNVPIAVLAKRLRVHPQALYRLEKGQNIPNPERIASYILAIKQLHDEKQAEEDQRLNRCLDLFARLIRAEASEDTTRVERLAAQITEPPAQPVTE